ncbi:MAG: PAS domain S-box protein [Candidatus Paceibacterota bacterium]
MDSYLLHEYRCDNCGKLIIKGILFKSYEEYKCSRCNKIVCFQGIANEDKPNRYLLLTDKNGIIINASSSIYENLGFSLNEITGKNIEELYLTDKDKKADERISSRIENFKYLRFETTHKTKNNDKVSVVVSFKFFRQDSKEYILRFVDKIIFPDELLELKNKFDSTNHCDFITETDLNGNLLYISTQAEKLYGYELGEVLGKNALEFFVPEEKEWRNNNMKALYHKKQSYRIPCLKIMHKEGSIIDCESFAMPLYDDLGNFIGYKHLHWIKK